MEKSIIEISQPHVGLCPVPVVLVSCIDLETNRPNIITVGWVGVVCSKPPLVSISIRPSRFSHKLIEKTGDFALNIPSTSHVAEVDFCGIESGRDIDKFEKTGFTPQNSTIISSPLINECLLNLECIVNDMLHLGSHSLFIGEIVKVHASKSILEEDCVDYSKLNAMVVNGLEYWDLKSKIYNVYGKSSKRRKAF